SLTKSGIFYMVGLISQIKGTQRIADIRGLSQSNPALGWGLLIGVAAIGLKGHGVDAHGAKIRGRSDSR
ncbi:MAG: hypothetical protein AAB363_01820, partial [Planctomycetota bacterium]